MPKIVPLPKEEYAGYELIFQYNSELYYDVRIHDTAKGFSVDFVRMPFPTVKQKQFVDRLYEAHWENPQAFGIFDGDTLAAVLEVSAETWNNRLRILNLLVMPQYRSHGYGRVLMDYAKEMAHEQNYRALVLETQSCNANAVAFYFSQGFMLSGFDAFAYSNDDIEKKEVRLEMVFKVPRTQPYS